MDERMVHHLKIVFICLYNIAKNNKTFSELPELVILTKKSSVDILPDYNRDEKITSVIMGYWYDIKGIGQKLLF
jgi:hypothetical protein